MVRQRAAWTGRRLLTTGSGATALAAVRAGTRSSLAKMKAGLYDCAPWRLARAAAAWTEPGAASAVARLSSEVKLES